MLSLARELSFYCREAAIHFGRAFSLGLEALEVFEGPGRAHLSWRECQIFSHSTLRIPQFKLRNKPFESHMKHVLDPATPCVGLVCFDPGSVSRPLDHLKTDPLVS